MVSSGTASLPKSSNTSSSQMIDLLTRHIRAILGQDFWSSEFDNGAGADTQKNKHYTFLELFMTVSILFSHSYLTVNFKVNANNQMANSFSIGQIGIDRFVSLILKFHFFAALICVRSVNALQISLYFLRSYFVNSPTAAVTDLDLYNAWKCKVRLQLIFTCNPRNLLLLLAF